MLTCNWNIRLWLIIVVISVIVNESGWIVVGGHTWPRLKSYGKIYSKDVLFSNATEDLFPIVNNTIVSTTTKPSPSDIQPRRDNGNFSYGSRCNHQQNNEKVDSGNTLGDNSRNPSGGRWLNDKNCMAGPFYLNTDMNETIFSLLCPASNKKFPIPGTCGWYLDCGNGEFTLNKCEDKGQVFDSTTSTCIKSAVACEDDSGENVGKLTFKEILNRIIRFFLRITGLQRATRIISQDTVNPSNVGGNRGGQLLQLENPLQNLDETTKIPSFAKSPSSPPNTTSSSSSSSSSDDVEKDIEHICATSSTHGLHPHPVSCIEYIHCATPGSYFIKKCGSGTVFNDEKLICDWPANVPHCKQTKWESNTPVTPLLNKLVLPGLKSRLGKRSISHSSDEIEDIVSVGMRLSLDSVDRKKRQVVARGVKCDGHDDKYIQPDDQYCNKYTICSNSRLVTVTCGRGTLFNPLTMVCDFADNVDCASRTKDFQTYGCDPEDSYKAPHPDFCNKFVECDRGILAIKSCPPGTKYDREKTICDHAFKVTCQNPISLEHDTDVNYKLKKNVTVTPTPDGTTKRRVERSPLYRQSRGNGNSLNLACDFNYIAPHPDVCNRFVECENGRIFIKTCGPGTAFNPVLGQCDWPHNVRVADPKDCTKYKQCAGTHYASKSCRRNQMFDPNQRACVNATPYQIQQCSYTSTTIRTTTTEEPFEFVPAN